MLDRVPTEDIAARAAQVDPARLVLTLLALPLLALGWVAAQAWAVAWAVISWSVAAIQVGWSAARPGSEADR